MAKIAKIEDRTIRFIQEYKRLKGANKIPSNAALAEIIGVASKTTVSEIIGQRQNIQPDQWEKFKAHFKITDAQNSSENSVSRGTKTESEVDFYRKEVMSSLEEIYNHVTGARAEIRGSIEYQAMKDARGNDERRREIMEQINRLIGLNLPVAQQEGNHADSGK